MSFRFLIDECLSPELARMAVAAGHVESTCVRDRGLAGVKDWKLIEHVVAGDYTLVTHNSVDFRGRAPQAPGGQHARQPIHAGLVCLNSALPMHAERQRDLLTIALEALAERKDLINQALEVFEDDDGSVTIVDCPIPASG